MLVAKPQNARTAPQVAMKCRKPATNMRWPLERERLQGSSNNKRVKITNLKFAMLAYEQQRALGTMRTVSQCGQPQERQCSHMYVTDTSHFLKLLITYAGVFHKKL